MLRNPAILAGLLGFAALLGGCAGGFSANVGIASSSSSYKGIVATRGYVANLVAGGANATWVMNRSYHIARDNISAGTLQVVWGNYLSNYGGDSTYGPGTYKAAMELRGHQPLPPAALIDQEASELSDSPLPRVFSRKVGSNKDLAMVSLSAGIQTAYLAQAEFFANPFVFSGAVCAPLYL